MNSLRIFAFYSTFPNRVTTSALPFSIKIISSWTNYQKRNFS